MAQKDSDGPSLELPSLRPRRRKHRRPDVAPEAHGPATTAEPKPDPEPAPDPAPTAPARARRGGPRVPTAVAVMVAGLLAGALLVGLTWVSLHVCELVRGTSSCGNPGVLLLLVVVVLTVLLGRALLAGLGVAEAGGTSFLGVGLVTVIALLASDLLLEWWMLVVIPAVAVVAFGLAHWVSTAFVEPLETGAERPPQGPPTEDWMHR